MKTIVNSLYEFEECLHIDLRVVVCADFMHKLEHGFFAFGVSPNKPLRSVLWLAVYEVLQDES